MHEKVEIEDVHLHLSQPHDAAGEWIGQREILTQLLACWIVVDEKDLPLTPRLIGTPGSTPFIWNEFLSRAMLSVAKISWR